MIVGNGPVHAGAAEAIDAADLVIRFNASRNYGEAGYRTDIVAICNTGRPAAAMLADRDWRESASVRRAGEIWSVRSPAKFAELRSRLQITHPELNDFCDDYTEALAAFSAAHGKRHRVLDRKTHEAVVHALARHRPEPYVVPSSGLVVVHHLLHDPAFAGHEIVITGFGHVGWEGHPFDAERRLIESHIAAGRLIRLKPLPASALSQGA
jgi:hypothetical protein